MYISVGIIKRDDMKNMNKFCNNFLTENICTVVNLNKSPYDIYIGRPSKWGNPFKTGNRYKDIQLFENYLINNKELFNSLFELKGKILGCFCKPKKCNGDIIAKYVNQL